MTEADKNELLTPTAAPFPQQGNHEGPSSYSSSSNSTEAVKLPCSPSPRVVHSLHREHVARAVLHRQYAGRTSTSLPPSLPSSSFPSRFYPLPPSLLHADDPFHYLRLNYTSHKHAGRMDYNYTLPGEEPMLALVSSLTSSLTVWRHPLTDARPSKVFTAPALHSAPTTTIKWSSLPHSPHEIYSAAEDGTVKVFHTGAQRVLADLVLPPDLPPPLALTPIDAVGTLAVGVGGQIVLWDRRSGRDTAGGGQGPTGRHHPGGVS